MCSLDLGWTPHVRLERQALTYTSTRVITQLRQAEETQEDAELPIYSLHTGTDTTMWSPSRQGPPISLSGSKGPLLSGASTWP